MKHREGLSIEAATGEPKPGCFGSKNVTGKTRTKAELLSSLGSHRKGGLGNSFWGGGNVSPGQTAAAHCSPGC